ncbi:MULTISPECIES: polysaccharide deacetylase family protein [unclassified Agromyces]|uniref:polysaccharide deacetylase family protein n=1 Tax=unclassified Agromyces TaxID=2639701 RepID=UPI0030153AD5
MGDVSRRTVVASLGIGTVLVFAKLASDARGGGAEAGGSAAAAAEPVAPAPDVPRTAVPAATLTGLPPEAGDVIAITLDDGTDSAVVAAYTAFAVERDLRLTYFVNGTYRSWTDNAETLRPHVASSRIQLANHTWSHPDLTTLDDAGIVGELQRNHDFLADVYGVDARPYWRPPYGRHDARVDAAAASVGYTVPTRWYGDLGPPAASEGEVLAAATEWFTAGRIVIGHLNHDPATRVFGHLADLLEERGLTTVTLNDVFVTEQHA